MGDPVLTADATLTCPHGGDGIILTAQVTVVAGSAVCTEDDGITFSPCSFTVSGAPSPCSAVEWKTTSSTCLASGAAVLTSGSIGVCTNAAGAPQGPVSIVPAQTAAVSP